MNICRVPTSSLYAKLAAPLICFTIIIGLLYYGQDVLKPLALSGLLAILLTSPSRFFERQGFPRGIAALISLIFALAVFIFVFYFISNSVISFRDDLPQMKQSINASIHELEAWAQRRLHLSTTKMQELMKSSTSKVIPKTSSIVNTALTTVSAMVFVLILIMIQTFLLLLYRGLIVSFFIALFAEQHSGVIYGMFVKVRFVIRSYIMGLFLEMLIVAVAYCGVLFFLGVKYALLLGIIGAILNIIPYLGIFMACVLSTLITLTTNSPATVLWMIISLIIIHMLDSNVLMPKIVGSKVKINALATIVGVIAFSALWGIPGTFMAVPIMAMMKVIFEEVPAFRPFAVIMGDDAQVAASPFMIRQIRHRVSKTPKKPG
ncbi:MAG: family transporter [Flaviaesturariibacter sp.]|nr:family transporter [Flaviaesturariibacter sp.]